MGSYDCTSTPGQQQPVYIGIENVMCLCRLSRPTKIAQRPLNGQANCLKSQPSSSRAFALWTSCSGGRRDASCRQGVWMQSGCSVLICNITGLILQPQPTLMYRTYIRIRQTSRWMWQCMAQKSSSFKAEGGRRGAPASCILDLNKFRVIRVQRGLHR